MIKAQCGTPSAVVDDLQFLQQTQVQPSHTHTVVNVDIGLVVQEDIAALLASSPCSPVERGVVVLNKENPKQEDV